MRQRSSPHVWMQAKILFSVVCILQFIARECSSPRILVHSRGQRPFLTVAKLARKARITKLFRWDLLPHRKRNEQGDNSHIFPIISLCKIGQLKPKHHLSCVSFFDIDLHSGCFLLYLVPAGERAQAFPFSITNGPLKGAFPALVIIGPNSVAKRAKRSAVALCSRSGRMGKVVDG